MRERYERARDGKDERKRCGREIRERDEKDERKRCGREIWERDAGERVRDTGESRDRCILFE